MNIIEVQALPNGAHRNQNNFSGDLPEGWAVIPDDMVIPDSFPFVGVEAEETPYCSEDGIELYTALTVTALTPGVMPMAEPAREPADNTEARLTELEEALDLLLSGATEVDDDEA